MAFIDFYLGLGGLVYFCAAELINDIIVVFEVICECLTIIATTNDQIAVVRRNIYCNTFDSTASAFQFYIHVSIVVTINLIVNCSVDCNLADGLSLPEI